VIESAAVPTMGLGHQLFLGLLEAVASGMQPEDVRSQPLSDSAQVIF
jgi:hypothetical protein